MQISQEKKNKFKWLRPRQQFISVDEFCLLQSKDTESSADKKVAVIFNEWQHEYVYTYPAIW